jgi:hypothetical protein
MKTSENGPQKLLIIGPNLFFTVQPSPQPGIDFSYYKNVTRHICLLICGEALGLWLAIKQILDLLKSEVALPL